MLYEQDSKELDLVSKRDDIDDNMILSYLNQEKNGFLRIFSKSVKRKDLKIDTIEKVLAKNDFYYKQKMSNEENL